MRESSAHPVPGDLIWIRRDRWRVQASHTGAGLCRVDAVRPPSTHVHTFLLPAESWWPDTPSRVRMVSARQAQAWLAACLARVCAAHTPSTIVRTHAELLPYQLEPALAVLAGIRRVLIADAVGLGKTVQAALIIAETLARRADARVLVLAPAPLLSQWTDELAGRFRIDALIAEPETFARLRAERPYLTNPWSGRGVWLASPDYIKQPHVLEGLPAEPWDVVVIDEAHTMSGDSLRAGAAHAIARGATHVVLLTATPHDGDQARLTRLLTLGGTGASTDTLRTFRRTRPPSSRRVATLHLAPGAIVIRMLAAIDAYERAARPSSQRAQHDVLHLICLLFRKRVLSSLSAFVASVDRRLAWVEQRAPTDRWEQLGLFADDEIGADEAAALTADAGMPVAQERSWLLRLRHISTTVRSAEVRSAGVRGAEVRGAECADRRLGRLRTLVRRVDEPVVIFTQYRDTLMAAAAALSAERRLAVLHGGLAPVEQRRALRAFCDGAADTLLATDVASQGLNLQHRARWVICLDLPWTPMRLEQRIGRVDRLGQSRRVHVTLLQTRHRAERDLRARVTQRQDAVASLALPSCQRWTRAALALAALFTRQRALAARWRGPDPVAIPCARVSAALLRAVTGEAGPPASPVTIVDVSLVSHEGDVVARHLAWHHGRPRRMDAAPLGVQDCAALPRALQRRVRALDARARRHEARQVAACGEPTRPAPTQRGLFEPRMDLAGFETGSQTQTGIHTPGAEPRAARVSAAAPRPLVVLEWRGSRR